MSLSVVATGVRSRLQVRQVSRGELDGSLRRPFDQCLRESLGRCVWPRDVREPRLLAYSRAKLLDGHGSAEPIWAAFSGRRLRAVAIPQALPWDSDIYRMPMARMSVVTGDSETARQYRVTEAVLAPAVALCDDRGVRHLSVRIDHHEYGVAAALGALGFWFVDATVTLMRPVTAPLPRTPQGRNRQASASDIPALQRVAASALVLGRAYHDPGLSLAANRELNRRWIANNCRGRAAQVLVAVDSQGLRGFICCNIDDASKALLGFAIGIVDLMAVAPAHQGRGVGYELLGAALRWFVSRADVVEIRTQLDNRVGLALYQKAGFCILSNGLALPSGYTFHRWRKA